jgi:hypothetical protein
LIVYFYSEGGVKTPSLFLNFFRSGNSGVNSFSLNWSPVFDSSKTDLLEPLLMDIIVSKIAIRKNSPVRIQVSFDKGFADFVPVPKP